MTRQVFSNETASFIEAYCLLVSTGALGGINGNRTRLLWTNRPNGDTSDESEGSELIDNIMVRFNESLHYTHHDICLEGDEPPLISNFSSFPGAVCPFNFRAFLLLLHRKYMTEKKVFVYVLKLW